MGRFFGLLFVALVGVIGFFLYRAMDHAGHFTDMTLQPVEGCRAIEGTIGGEDLIIDHETGWVFISAYDRRKALAGEYTRGNLVAAPVDQLGEGFRDLARSDLPGSPEHFAPHGISLFKSDGKTTLAVINHASVEASQIEFFRVIYDDDPNGGTVPRLQHLWTVTSEHLRNPNDIVLVGHDQYYVTNDHWYEPGFLYQVETLLVLDKTTLVYGEGQHIRVVDRGLSYANGVNTSADGLTVFVSETTKANLRVYDRDPATGDLVLKAGDEGIVSTFHGPDNIDRAPDGSIWLTGHPKLLKFSNHVTDPAEISPTQVMRFPVTEDGALEAPTTVYGDDGAQLTGGSVAAQFGGQFVVGTVFGPELLVCPYPDGK